jgi:hypothetical protein
MSEHIHNSKRSRLLTNDDLKALVESREGGGFVTMLNPLELFLSTELLEQLTRDSLAALRNNRKPDETAEQKVSADRAIQQRIDFLAWLDTQRQPDIYMSLYPADMDGLDELDDLEDLDDLQEFLDDEDGQRELPF